jgi:hypothetical protein
MWSTPMPWIVLCGVSIAAVQPLYSSVIASECIGAKLGYQRCFDPVTRREIACEVRCYDIYTVEGTKVTPQLCINSTVAPFPTDPVLSAVYINTWFKCYRDLTDGSITLPPILDSYPFYNHVATVALTVTVVSWMMAMTTMWIPR